MTPWIGAVPLNSLIPEILRRSFALSIFKPVGIGVEQGCELKQPCFCGRVPGLAGQAPREFRFRADGVNRFLGHKSRLLLVDKRKARPLRGRGGPSPSRIL